MFAQTHILYFLYYSLILQTATAAKLHSSHESSKMFSLKVKAKRNLWCVLYLADKESRKKIPLKSVPEFIISTGSMNLHMQPKPLREPNSQLVPIDFRGDRPGCIGWGFCQSCWQKDTDEESAMQGLELTWQTWE